MVGGFSTGNPLRVSGPAFAGFLRLSAGYFDKESSAAENLDNLTTWFAPRQAEKRRKRKPKP